MHISRRNLLMGALASGGWLGLRALSTGIPASILASPGTALADEQTTCDTKRAPQYLILSASNDGDPLNANVPGTYDDTNIVHPADPRMARTELFLGDYRTAAARPWASLHADVLKRTAFVHHRSLTNNHGNLGKVLGLMGSVRRNESLVSLLSRSLAPCHDTIQDAPVALGEPMTFKGRFVPTLQPTVLRDVLLSSRRGAPLLTDTLLPKLRDQTLDEISEVYKSHGNVVQKRMLDNLALSREQVRSLSDQLLSALDLITNDGPEGQVIAAAALIKMNVTPVVTIRIPFGGDNHTDGGLAQETNDTIAGVGTINTLMAQLASFELSDKVTFAMLNVFGRTLKRGGTTGRAHSQAVSAAILIGKNVKAGVCGGVEQDGQGDYSSRAIDSRTGVGTDSGDISTSETLAAVGKTLGAAVGVPQSVLDDSITRGKVITAALAE